MTRFDTPKQVHPLLLTKGDVFKFANQEFIFENHRKTRSAATKVSDGRSYTMKLMNLDKVTVVGKETPKTPEYKKKLAKPGDLRRGDLFVIIRKQPELFRFVRYGSKPHIVNATSVLDGKPIKLTGFDCVKVDDLPF